MSDAATILLLGQVLTELEGLRADIAALRENSMLAGAAEPKGGNASRAAKETTAASQATAAAQANPRVKKGSARAFASSKPDQPRMSVFDQIASGAWAEGKK